MENVVTENEAAGSAVDEFLTDDQRLCQAFRLGLLGIFQAYAPVPAVAEQVFEHMLLLGCSDDQDIPDAGQHQCGQRVENHRLVVYRKQLFADHARQGVQPCPAAAGQYDAFPRQRSVSPYHAAEAAPAHAVPPSPRRSP